MIEVFKNLAQLGFDRGAKHCLIQHLGDLFPLSKHRTSCFEGCHG